MVQTCQAKYQVEYRPAIYCRCVINRGLVTRLATASFHQDTVFIDLKIRRENNFQHGDREVGTNFDKGKKEMFNVQGVLAAASVNTCFYLLENTLPSLKAYLSSYFARLPYYSNAIAIVSL